MKKVIFNAVAVCALLAGVTGCDFFRSLAGLPTSAVIAELKAKADTPAVATDTLTNVTDSLVAANADTVAVQTADTCEIPNSEALTSETAPEAVTPAPEQETITPAPAFKTVYYILVGSFADKSNADNMAKTVRKYGYEPHILKRGRLTCVGLCPTEDIAAANKALNIVRKHSFCPADVCIYSRTEQL